MSFAGINYLAVFVAAIAGFMVGGVWYGALFKDRWMKAAGLSKEDICPEDARQGSNGPFIIAGLADLLMAWMLAGIIGHAAGEIGLAKGLLAALFVWLGFVLTTNSVNNAFQMKPLALTIIDAGHWLVVLLVMGGIIGLFGV